ncbi:hypothetical protein F5Y10DRAFT_197449 [Nemania abortiva]|nr:hypothetical protein F5Y10DRAFT_197449 [Nemania abortiva]
MPPFNSHHRHQYRSSSARAAIPSEPQFQSQQHARSSSSTAPPPPSASSLGGKTRSAHTPRSRDSQSTPERRQNRSLAQPRRSRREDAERVSRIPATESQHYSHRPRSGPSDQKQSSRPLRTKDILKSPRLQEVTGLLPRKLNLLGDVEIPPDELYRLAWAMTLPEPFPSKRPRGNF